MIPPLGEHRGVTFYTTNEYVKYDGGDQFQNYINNLDVSSVGEAVDFYHIDHWVRDNPLNGKFFDVFSADFSLDYESYNKLKTQILESETYTYECIMEDFELWIQEDLPNVFLIAFCDEKMTIRCILATDRDSAQGIAGGLAKHTGLMWETE